MDLKDNNYLEENTGQSGSGTKNDMAPPGYYWNSVSGTYEQIIIVVKNQPDGHTYRIEKSVNKEGLIWFTLTTENNLTDAESFYNQQLANGGTYQLLQDGIMIKNNVPAKEEYYGSTIKKVAPYTLIIAVVIVVVLIGFVMLIKKK